jgi:plasmid stabilization system protein ParE
MSGSDESGEHQAELKWWLVRAAIMAALLIAVGGIQHAIHYNDAATQAARYSREARDQIAAECRTPAAYTKCKRDIVNAARSNQRDEYDLYSQKAMALWTAVMAGMTIFGIALSGVGVFLLWRTWQQTGEAASYSRKTHRSYIARERAFFRCGTLHYATDNNSAFDKGFVVKLENYGASAGIVEKVEWEYLNGPVWPDKFRFMKYDKRTLVSDAEGRTPLLYCEKFPDVLDKMWLVGTVFYRTMETEVYESHFCFELYQIEDDGYQGAHWSITPAICAGRPDDT